MFVILKNLTHMTLTHSENKAVGKCCYQFLWKKGPLKRKSLMFVKVISAICIFESSTIAQMLIEMKIKSFQMEIRLPVLSNS